jgi:phosphohistidine swiveling domain-containing protein
MDVITILQFDSPHATLLTAGGKGANLARLSRAGFNVPRGFIVTTEAYRAFVAANGLAAVISASLANLTADDAAQLETASAQIRAAFAGCAIPAALQIAVRSAYANLNQPSEGAPQIAVAVRSSATAEDLPDLSFAGQQDTYLNIVGEAPLFEAVVNCWSSLWTARAIGYRTRNQIAHAEAAVAVVVQAMVPSEVSGVLFTANPLTGQLRESVIDATFGLGEALVSGQVEPDHFVVDSLSGVVTSVTLGAKKIATRGKAGGGVENVVEDAAARQTLTDAALRQLAAIGQRIQEEYGAPQDIEWAFADGQLFILQSRAITSLFPVPFVSFDPLTVWFSFGAVQGLVGPLTPLGQDGIRYVAGNSTRIFGVPPDLDHFSVFAQAGERIWIKISDLIRHPLGNRIFSGALGFVEPSIRQIMRPLAADPRLNAGQGKLKLSTVWRLARFALPTLARLAGNMLRPDQARARFDADIEAYFASAHIAPDADRFARLANIITFMRERMAGVFAYLMPRFIPIFGPSMAALNFLNQFSPQLALTVTRGLPRNVTTEMDLALWATATAIKADAAAAALFHATDAPELARQFLRGALPSAAQSAIARFLDKYGMRGVGEIDFGQPRWREDPAPVIHTLQSYLQIAPEFAPDVVFAKGEQAALDAIEKLAATARGQKGGWLKEKLVRAFARRIRLLMGARESPKFFAIRTMGIARQALLEVGQEFAEAGAIERADDLVFLKLAELEKLSQSNDAAQKAVDWKALIAVRRATYARELRRRQVPRVLISDGRAFYEGLGSQTDTSDVITGSPVSPGVVEGVVHVVLDPRGTHLAPGEILVCPGTDPAWTPLFMAAGGLITEVGGMMTHGSVVAREYGIPAVVGVHQATLRLKSGQRIRVNGSTGQIVLLPPS